jgi:hypothetical protein
LGRDVIGWGQLVLVVGVGVSGLLVSCGGGMYGVPLRRGVDGFGSVLGVGSLGVSMAGVVPRACIAGDGFHALHWNMLSWFGGCINVLRGFLFGWGERDVVGGWILCPGRVVDGRILYFGRVWAVGVAGRWGSGLGGSHSLGFLWGCGNIVCMGSVCVGGWLGVPLWVGVDGRLRLIG